MNISKFILLAFLSLFLIQTTAVADEIKINVHSIECDVKRSDLDQPVNCSPELLDLKGKLSKLPFENFKSAGLQQAMLSKDQKQTFQLKTGDLLTLELLYQEQSRIGLLVDWKDRSNMQLLDTRMHFDRSETMLAGADTDSEANSGKILAISVAE